MRNVQPIRYVYDNYDEKRALNPMAPDRDVRSSDWLHVSHHTCHAPVGSSARFSSATVTTKKSKQNQLAFLIYFKHTIRKKCHATLMRNVQRSRCVLRNHDEKRATNPMTSIMSLMRNVHSIRQMLQSTDEKRALNPITLTLNKILIKRQGALRQPLSFRMLGGRFRTCLRWPSGTL